MHSDIALRQDDNRVSAANECEYTPGVMRNIEYLSELVRVTIQGCAYVWSTCYDTGMCVCMEYVLRYRDVCMYGVRN